MSSPLGNDVRFHELLSQIEKSIDNLRQFEGVNMPEGAKQLYLRLLELNVHGLESYIEGVSSWAEGPPADEFERAIWERLRFPYVAGDWLLAKEPVVRIESAEPEPETSFAEETSAVLYLDTDDLDVSAQVQTELTKFAEQLGYGDFTQVEEVRGSIFRRWSGKIRDGVTSEFVQERLQEVDEGLRLQTLAKWQSEVDATRARSTVDLINSLADVPNAVVRVGGIMIVKFTDSATGPVVMVRTLTNAEVRVLEQNPGIQRDPRHVLELLATAVYEVDDQPDDNGG